MEIDMQVILRRNWFTTTHGRFKKSPTRKGPPVEIPDELRPQLPSDAVVIEDFISGRMAAAGIHSPEDVHTEDPALGRNTPTTLAEGAKMFGADPDRAAGEAEEEAKRKAEENRLEAKRAKLQKQIEAEDADIKASDQDEAEAEAKAEAEAVPITPEAPAPAKPKRGPGRPRKNSK